MPVEKMVWRKTMFGTCCYNALKISIHIHYEDNVNMLHAVAFLPMEMHRLFRKRKIRFKCDEITIIKLLRQRSPYGVWRKACNLSSCLFRLLAILLVMELAHGSCTVFRYTVNCLKTHLKFLTFLSLYPPCIHFQLFCVSFVIVDISHSVANGSICKTRTSIHCEITSQMPCIFIFLLL